MLKKLQHQFISVAVFAFIGTLGFIIALINFLNFRSVIRNADDTLEYLAMHEEGFPTAPDQEDKDGITISPETPYETRFFSVHFAKNNKITEVKLDKIAAIDKNEAEQYGRNAITFRGDRGFLYNYRYFKTYNEEGTVITFLDCTRSLQHALVFMLWSFIITLTGILVITAVLILISGRVMKPMAESYEKQRRFITDAGHDIKTPLTVINADAELLELEYGKSEWIDDIKKQAERMTALTNELIYLSKIDENPNTHHIDFPISDALEETLRSFCAVVTQRNLTLDESIMRGLYYSGDENQIRKLFTLLLDNATKYSKAGERIFVSLRYTGRNLHFKISNPARDLSDEMVKHLFDRFYRSDSSRSTEGGFGIGLSVADAIVSSHKGKITAKKDGERLVIEIIL